MGTTSSNTSVADTITNTNVNNMNPGEHRNPLPPIPPLYSSVDSPQRQTYSPSGTHTMSSMPPYSQSPQGFGHIPVNPVPGPTYHKIAQPLHQQETGQQPVYPQYTQAYSQGPYPPQSYGQQYYPPPSGYQQPYSNPMHPMSQQYIAQPMPYQQPSQRYEQTYNRPFQPDQRAAMSGYPQPSTTQPPGHPTVQHPVPQMATAQQVPYQPYSTYPPTSQNPPKSVPPSNLPPPPAAEVSEESGTDKIQSESVDPVQEQQPSKSEPSPDAKGDQSDSKSSAEETEEVKEKSEEKSSDSQSDDSKEATALTVAQKKETVKAGKSALLKQAVAGAAATGANLMPVVGFDEKPCEWLVGDLVWSKVSGHPWWPCMVAYDPNLGIYTRMKGGGVKSYRMYHVQFFGEVPERGWVSGASMRKFASREQYDSLIKELVAKIKNKTDRQRVLQKNSLKPNRKPAWDVAVTECVRALPMSRHERKLNFTFKYEMPKAGLGSATTEEIDIVSLGDSPKMKAKRAYKKHQDDEAAAVSTSIPLVPKKSTNEKSQEEEKSQTSELEESATDQVTTPLPVKQKRQYKKKLKVSEEEASSEAESPTKKKRGRKPLPFVEYSKVFWDEVEKENPGVGKKGIYTILEEKWDALPEDEKAQYNPTPVKPVPEKKRKQREDDSDGKPVTPTKRSKRESRPSLKMQEADFDSIGFSPEMAKTLKAKEKQETPKEKPGKQQAAATPSQKAKTPSTKRQRAMPVKEPIKPVESIPKSDSVIPPDVITYDPSKKSRKRKSKKLVESSLEANQQTEKEKPAGAVEANTIENNNPASGASSSDESHANGKASTGAGASRKENVCQVCETPGELLLCEGSCCGAFHLDCIGLGVMPTGTFKCDECISGVHCCFICKKGDDTVKRCNVSVCGKFYHELCVKTFPQARFDNRGFICPLHTCTACAAENPKNIKASKGRLMRCVRCPTAYHYGDSCIAAGSMVLASNAIVCSRHFQPIKTQKHHSHVSVSWCFTCSKGGNLLCCESCPAAFHPDCIGYASIPDGRWFCRDCSNGKRPQYDDIVWVKVGNYRWWPGRVCIPRNVPLNIQEKTHQVGEFPVHFFGSNDYFWTHQARVFAFQEGDKGSRDSTTSKGIAAVFKQALVEATANFKEWKAIKEKRVAKDKQENDKKPAPFKYIKVNKPVGNVIKAMPAFDISQCQPCECKPNMTNPCGDGSDCLNRMLQVECHPTVCPAGENCQNQRFQKRQYPDSIPFKTGPRGWGLMTKVDIKKGDFVNEYVGELVDDEECHRRIRKDHEDNISNFYFLTLDKDRTIDAGPKGNMSRFMNHCCWPNCETQKWTVNGDIRVGLFAVKDIKAGSELNFNYNLDCLGNEKKKCECGADNCSGFIGVRAKTAAAEATEEKLKKAKDKKKRKKRKLEVKHEDFCFRCGEGGALIMCDRKTCLKSYHLTCLKLEKKPYGKWDCPWHHCDECGKVAKLLCVICPNSYCDTHKENKSKVVEGVTVCIEHSDDEVVQELSKKKVDPKNRKSVGEGVPPAKKMKTAEENKDVIDKEEETSEVTNGDETKKDKNENETEKPSGKKKKEKKEKHVEEKLVKETKTVSKPEKGKRSKKEKEKLKEEKIQNLLQGSKPSKKTDECEKNKEKVKKSDESWTGNGVHNSTSDDEELGALIIDEEPVQESKKKRKRKEKSTSKS